MQFTDKIRRVVATSNHISMCCVVYRYETFCWVV